jgi:hypothetical protein
MQKALQAELVLSAKPTPLHLQLLQLLLCEEEKNVKNVKKYAMSKLATITGLYVCCH